MSRVVCGWHRRVILGGKWRWLGGAVVQWFRDSAVGIGLTALGLTELRVR